MFEVLSILLFALSFVLIFTGGDLLVSSAIWLSRVTKISPIVIGATIVSIATTLPETSISLLAVRHGDMIFASNNAFGSMICNFALILGIAFTFLPSEVDARGFKNKCIFIVLNFFLLLIFAIDRKISNLESILLLVLLVLFLISNIFEARKHKDIKLNWYEEEARQNPVIMIVQFVVGAIAIAYGSHILVTNASSIGRLLKIDQRVLALTIIAVGTGLPELVTTITSIKKKSAGIGVGNMLGANVMNGTMLLGICGLFSKGRLTLGIRVWSALIVLAIVNLVAILPIITKGRSSRRQGILLLVIYVTYVIVLYLTA